ncbi:MAG: DUF6602 domain-containing protein [Nitrososphaera sp.]
MIKENNILVTYFDGVTQRLQAEIDYINKLIGHRGETGKANEQLLVELLKKFLPKVYSIGSGIIIDKDGNRSKQIDIIVYDSQFHPELFAQGTAVIFPVDVVYMTIEVKTTLNKQSVEQAVENIASVKQLNFIPAKIVSLKHHEPGGEKAASMSMYDSSPPIGVIFGYTTETRNENTFAEWFASSLNEKPNREKFDLAYVLETTFLYASPNISENSVKPNHYVQGVFTRLQDGKALEVQTSGEHTTEGRKYPIIDVGEHHYVVDPARGFLNFLSSLNDILSEKQVIKTSIIKTYLPDQLSQIFQFD